MSRQGEEVNFRSARRIRYRTPRMVPRHERGPDTNECNIICIVGYSHPELVIARLGT